MHRSCVRKLTFDSPSRWNVDQVRFKRYVNEVGGPPGVTWLGSIASVWLEVIKRIDFSSNTFNYTLTYSFDIFETSFVIKVKADDDYDHELTPKSFSGSTIFCFPVK